MGLPPVTLWSTATHSCVLRKSDGQLEVLLCHDGRTIRLHTCDSESTARRLAYDWKIALDRHGHLRAFRAASRLPPSTLMPIRNGSAAVWRRSS